MKEEDRRNQYKRLIISLLDDVDIDVLRRVWLILARAANPIQQ